MRSLLGQFINGDNVGSLGTNRVLKFEPITNGTSRYHTIRSSRNPAPKLQCPPIEFDMVWHVIPQRDPQPLNVCVESVLTGGKGPMETSEYIVNTLKALVQFTQPFLTRYILGTFRMLLCYLPNMFPKYFHHMPSGHMLRTLSHFGYILITLAHCKCIQHEPNFFQFDYHVIFGCMLGTFEE